MYTTHKGLTPVKEGKAFPIQALTVLKGLGSQISRHLAHEGDRVVNPMPFTPQIIFLVFISVRGRVGPRAIVWPEGLCQ